MFTYIYIYILLYYTHNFLTQQMLSNSLSTYDNCPHRNLRTPFNARTNLEIEAKAKFVGSLALVVHYARTL